MASFLKIFSPRPLLLRFPPFFLAPLFFLVERCYRPSCISFASVIYTPIACIACFTPRQLAYGEASMRVFFLFSHLEISLRPCRGLFTTDTRVLNCVPSVSHRPRNESGRSSRRDGYLDSLSRTKYEINCRDTFFLAPETPDTPLFSCSIHCLRGPWRYRIGRMRRSTYRLFQLGDGALLIRRSTGKMSFGRRTCLFRILFRDIRSPFRRANN